jgi:hypothetical protein
VFIDFLVKESLSLAVNKRRLLGGVKALGERFVKLVLVLVDN